MHVHSHAMHTQTYLTQTDTNSVQEQTPECTLICAGHKETKRGTHAHPNICHLVDAFMWACTHRHAMSLMYCTSAKWHINRKEPQTEKLKCMCFSVCFFPVNLFH